MPSYDHMGWGWGIFATLGLLLLLALVVGVALTLIGDRRRATSREILDRRLASGDISVEQYERTRDVMTATPRTDRSSRQATAAAGAGASSPSADRN